MNMDTKEIAASRQLILDIHSIKITKARQTVKLVPQLYIGTQSDDFTAQMGFKIGIDKLYVVKNAYELFDVIGTNGNIEYGKNFVFDDSRHVFEPEIKGLINLLVVASRKKPELASQQKEFELTGNLKTAVIRELEGVETDIFINGRYHPHTKVINDNIPIDLSLSKSDNQYRIDFEDCLMIEPISSDCGVCLYNDNIYVVSIEQAGCLSALLKAYNTMKEPYITFLPEDKTKVITHLMPKLRSAAKLKIDANVKRDVIMGDLAVKLYIDKTPEGYIKVKACFCYESAEFNHFAGEKPVIEGKVLLRDRRSENNFIRTAAAMGFHPEKGYLYLYDDEKIYTFLTEGIAALKQFGEIYYSDTFNQRVIAPAKSSIGVSVSSGNLLEFDMSFDDISKEEIADVLRSVKEKKKFHRLKDGSFIDLNANGIKNTVKLIDELDATVDEDASFSAPLSRAFFLNSLNSDSISLSRDIYFEHFIDKFNNVDVEDFKLPPNMESVLRPYQVVGFKWLKLLAQFKLGGILADEMGLGKTLQAIAFVMSEYEKTQKPTLIVAPTSLLYNWQSEIEKFAPQAKSVIVSATPSERSHAERKIDGYHFVITSYGLLRRDISNYIKYEFAYCFIDEAQHIKNPNTINAKVVKKIKAGSFFALTGTPLENTLTELWSIFDFIMPGYLYGRHKFRKTYEIPIIKEEDRIALEDLLRHTRPFILRRLKSQVMSELPEKIESYMVCELEPTQRSLYAAYASEAKDRIDVLSADGGFNRNRIEILAIITRLRQICCHPALFVENYEGGSGKLDMLKEIIEEAVMSGHRILVFSQFTSMLSIISGMLRMSGIDHFYLDGNTKSRERLNLVNEFNGGACDVFLISLKAGGTGLNLTGADMVIHYDPWWNPAVENQATDRAHRIGQTKTVQVLKLVTKGTIEEKICNLQKVKQNMIDSVIETGETLISSMSLSEIKSLFDD